MDFLKDNYFLVIYGITLILSIVRYPKYFDSLLKYFPILIAYTLLCEILGVLIRDSEDFQIYYGVEFANYNALIYNIFDFIFYLYFFKIFKKKIQDKTAKTLIGYGAVLFVVVSIVNPFLQDIWIFPQSYAIAVGSVVLITGIFFYLKELKKAKTKISDSRNLLFWISLGLLLFYSIYPFLVTNWIWSKETYRNLHIKEVHLFLIALMYGCFIIGFLRMRRVKPSAE